MWTLILLILLCFTLAALFSPNVVYAIHKEHFKWINPMGNPPTEHMSVRNKYKHLDIEYMPLVGRYYPRHKRNYLVVKMDGSFETRDYIVNAEYALDEKDAIKIYDKYLESIGVTSKIIKPY